MKKLLVCLVLILPLNVYGVDPAVTEANNQYFEILQRIEIIKDKARPLITRQQAFSNLANEFAEPGAHWQTLKLAVLDIIITDASFWANEIIQFPAMQEKLLRNFSMDWYQDSSSNYNEILALAKIQITRELEKGEIRKAMLIKLKTKLDNTKATTLK